MDAATATLFPSEFQGSQLSPIPTGWKVGSIGDVCIRGRGSVSVKELTSDYNYVGLEHISRKSWPLIDWSSAISVASNMTKYQKYDVLFGKLRPYFHKVSVAPISGVCSTDILVLQPPADAWYGFMLNHVSRDALIDYAARLSNGAKMPRTSWEDIATYRIAIPTLAVATSFNSLARLMVERLVQSISQIPRGSRPSRYPPPSPHLRQAACARS